MPELKKNRSICLMQSIYSELPTFYLFIVVYARGLIPADSLLRNHCGFGQDQSGRGTLTVVTSHETVRNSIEPGSGASHGGHYDAIFDREVRKVERF